MSELVSVLLISAGVILLILFCLFAFCGIFAIIPFVLGVFVSFLNMPILIISRTIYPVGVLPYVVLNGVLFFLAFRWIFGIITKIRK